MAANSIGVIALARYRWQILDLSPAQQARLLRVIQEKEIVPLGTARGLTVDVRFLAATQRPFVEVTVDGEFRKDPRARLDGTASTCRR